jgi:uncharacterized heparinase superfamily protein
MVPGYGMKGARVELGSDRWRLYGLALREAGRAGRGRIACALALPSLRAPAPKRLLFAPQDLRTADPTVAGDIYAGFFTFAGRSVATGGRSPFEVEPPSRPWGEALYGFGWLRHLRAAGTALAQANARALVDEFVSVSHADRSLVRDVQVKARRLISFISQSPLILEGADHAFYNRFLRTLGRTVRELERDMRREARPYRQLLASIAVCHAGLCCEGFDGPLRRAMRVLVRELDRQILPDGGHASRNPQVLLDLLFDLLPLRQMFASREVDTPASLVHAIDRILPMVRLFRHGDGTLSHFNGMGLTAADHLATLLTYDDLRSQPIHHAPHSGYERIEAGRALLVADVGACPPTVFSSDAGAGCLSFEFSSGSHRIIVNCGLPRTASPSVIQAARSTPAHSTLSVGDISSCRFLAAHVGLWPERLIARWLVARLGPVALRGPAQVGAERGERDHVQLIEASHDSYRRRFGLVHQRRWRLAAEGERLEGEDVLKVETPGAEGEALIRFHLAPGIRASRAQGGRVVMLILPNREAWQFEVSPGEARLEDSVFFSAADGARRTEQIVVPVRLGETASVRWRFERLMRPQETNAQHRRTEPSPELL